MSNKYINSIDSSCYHTKKDMSMFDRINTLRDYKEFQIYDTFEGNLPISYAKHTHRHLNKHATADTTLRDQYLVSENTDNVTYSQHCMKIATNSLSYATLFTNFSFIVDNVKFNAYKYRNVTLNAFRDMVPLMFKRFLTDAIFTNIDRDSTIETMARYMPARFEKFKTFGRFPRCELFSDLFSDDSRTRRHFFASHFKNAENNTLTEKPGVYRYTERNEVYDF